MKEASDAGLLRQYAEENSEEAFSALVARHVNLVYSAALRKTGNPAASEEITQAVFVILGKKAAQLSGHNALSGWLYQAARLTSANFLRTEIRRAHREQEAYMQSLSDQTEPEIWPRIIPLLEDAMGQLGEKDRNALVLRFFERKSFQEIGSAYGASENAAKKRVAHALEKLRKHFSRRGVTSTTAAIAGAIAAHSVQAAPITLAKTATAAALANGATASTSTLTLIKGALKLMAWSKAKTAIVAGAVIIVTAVPTVSIMYYSHRSRPIQTAKMKLPTGDNKPTIDYSYSGCIFVLSSDGSLWSWGDERLGWPVLGYAKVENTPALRRIGDQDHWSSIAIGDSQCLAIKSDGTLWGWGENLNYQLGDGSKVTRSAPVRSVPGHDWKQAITGDSSLALKNDGTLWAWGSDWSGQLGIGEAQKVVTNAVQVGDSANWSKIWGGGIQTVGMQKDGSLWFWGSLTGSGKDTNCYLVPTRISPDTNWTDVCFGYFTMFALKSDGTLWTWGLKADIYNGGPDNGIDGSGVQLTPAQIGAETDWQSFSSSRGCFYLLLRKREGSLWALDATEHRVIKSPNSYKPFTPRKINFQKDIAAYAAGGNNIGVILTPDGEVWTWGNVLGEHTQKDFIGPNHHFLSPKYKVTDEPWQVSNIESKD